MFSKQGLPNQFTTVIDFEGKVQYLQLSDYQFHKVLSKIKTYLLDSLN